MERKNPLGEAIRLIRDQRGLPQEGIGASQSYISDVERGGKAPSLEKLRKISAAMEVHFLSILAISCLLEDPEIDLETLLERVRAEAKTAVPSA